MTSLPKLVFEAFAQVLIVVFCAAALGFVVMIFPYIMLGIPHEPHYERNRDTERVMEDTKGKAFGRFRYGAYAGGAVGLGFLVQYHVRKRRGGHTQ